MKNGEQIGKSQDAASLIYTTLKKEILNLSIKPGEEVSESSICSRFNASRTPVREAFMRLQNAGLLTTVSYKGSIASLLDYDAIQQVIYMRSIVESAVLSDFIKSITPYQIEELRYRINIQRILVSNDIDIQKFFEADYEFHSIWFSHEKKELLWKIIQRSQFHYSRFRMLDLKDTDHCKDIFDEHVVLFSHIEKKEIDKVSRFINEHLQGGMHRIAERITKDYASYFL
mgnify:FL=1